MKSRLTCSKFIAFFASLLRRFKRMAVGKSIIDQLVYARLLQRALVAVSCPRVIKGNVVVVWDQHPGLHGTPRLQRRQTGLKTNCT